MMNRKKRILLLGGSAAQLIAIKTARRLGYYTVVCDYLSDNPGQYLADSFHLVSTTDKDAVLKVAEEEKIDGIVAYGSDPAAPTAAYVANKLGLPGLDYNTVRTFCEKQLFRDYLKKNGFNSPKSVRVSIPYDIANIDIRDLTFPIIIKPTDSSGSKGVSVIHDLEELDKALKYGEKYSRNNVLIIEEFIQRDHPHVIEAEIFVVNGEVVSWGLINSIRDSNTNPLLPAGYTYPLDISEERLQIVKTEIRKLIHSMGDSSGAFNIEMIIDKKNKLYFLDAGPRNGGNMLPEFISMISGKDLVEATLRNCMGENNEINVELDGKSGGYWGLGVLHTDKKGTFLKVEYSSIARNALVREDLQKKYGETITPFSRCNDLIGLSFFHFNNSSDMKEVMYDMTHSIFINKQ